ncbi:MAG: Ig-like domain-containing protein, partial [Pseudomonadota bacterium]
YAEEFYVLHDQDGNCYYLIEIELAGVDSTDREDFFAFYGDVPPAGADLTVAGKHNVYGNWLKYKKLSAGLIWDLDEDGKVTVEAEDMALSGYRVDDVDAASGGNVIRLRKGDGEASIVFGAEAGTYDLNLAYIDESDGQGSIEVLVNGVQVALIDLTADNNGNGNDASTISTLLIEDLELAAGDEILLRGERDAWEFARIDALTFCAKLNEAPVTADVAVSGDEDTVIAGVLDATDADGDELIYTLVDGPANGSVQINQDGTFEYTPADDFNGVETFTYAVDDGTDVSNTATVTITVDAVNDAPELDDIMLTLTESEFLAMGTTGIDLLAAATDVENDTLSISDLGGLFGGVGQTGSVRSDVFGSNALEGEVSAEGIFTYRIADGEFYNLQSALNDNTGFSFVVSDGNGGLTTAQIAITITGENEAPEGQDTSETTNNATVLEGTLTATDADNDTLIFSLDQQPAFGTAVVNLDGTYTYTANPGYVGPDSFTYMVDDQNGGVITHTVSIEVTNTN